MAEYQSLLHQKPDYLVCTCMGVMYSEIVTAIGQGNDSFDSLQEALLVGTGCSSCVAEIYELCAEKNSLLKQN